MSYDTHDYFFSFLVASVRMVQWKCDKFATWFWGHLNTYLTYCISIAPEQQPKPIFILAPDCLFFVIWDYLVQKEHPHTFCRFYTHYFLIQIHRHDSIQASRPQPRRVQEHTLLHGAHSTIRTLTEHSPNTDVDNNSKAEKKNKTSLVSITSLLCNRAILSCLIRALIFIQRLWFLPWSPSVSSQLCFSCYVPSPSLSFPLTFFPLPCFYPSSSVSLADVAWSDGILDGRSMDGLQAH